MTVIDLNTANTKPVNYVEIIIQVTLKSNLLTLIQGYNLNPQFWNHSQKYKPVNYRPPPFGKLTSLGNYVHIQANYNYYMCISKQLKTSISLGMTVITLENR